MKTIDIKLDPIEAAIILAFLEKVKKAPAYQEISEIKRAIKSFESQTIEQLDSYDLTQLKLISIELYRKTKTK